MATVMQNIKDIEDEISRVAFCFRFSKELECEIPFRVAFGCQMDGIEFLGNLSECLPILSFVNSSISITSHQQDILGILRYLKVISVLPQLRVLQNTKIVAMFLSCAHWDLQGVCVVGLAESETLDFPIWKLLIVRYAGTGRVATCTDIL
ncbi:hypothetical protein L2E82_25456 [Cichorium intybus]|uniref:Uncharacterized protein n=1 Tax=Cichorium intybus TaxID=13427 RepID=A0ACB9E392_CICIN|nr:hypothetical protein L2E82_25456 [Cichorium intybus]